jgi:tRNA(fMet)-specific endonuclease VapC
VEELEHLGVAGGEIGDDRFAKSRDPAANRARLDQFLLPLILRFDDAAAASYGTVRADLEARGVWIGPIDTLLAAQALSLAAVMVTNNTGEFERVPGLVVEDWSRKAT